ncbi:hypothetical protein JHL17_28655 [Azospirillum sp. YIM B02556]|uniref:Cysteine rich repeat-containing protein n=1 Tax=Azospirillum endophyticum TaxID=2800326 RepID=A0ABS1FD66_9PROT|nr:hypothetical protein [Azospirillum endophyticum]MBK1841378.1 hypothetical protein [Azospirillum endophyticum]
MVRVTAFLRVSLMSAALTATALGAALPVLATTATTAAAASSQGAGSQKPGHGGQDHGGKPPTAGAASSNAGAQAGGAASAPQATTPAAGCLKPGVPLCMDDQSTFLSADKMSSCQGEVKEYVDKSMAYLTCLNEENVATGRELSRNVDRFNCRLSGRKGCAN